MARMNRSVQKPKDMKRALGKLISYCRKEFAFMILALVLAALGTVLTIIGPSQISRITDYMYSGLTGQIDMDGIFSVCIRLLSIYLLSALCTFAQHFITATVTQQISRRMRSGISAKINRLPLQYFSENSYGDVLSRVTNDVDTIGQGLSNSAASIVSAAAQFAGCLVMMFWTNWIMGTTTVATTLLGILFMGFLMKHSQHYFSERQRSLGELNGYIEEMYSGHDVIRISHGEQKVRERFLKRNLAVKEADFKSQFLSGLMQPVMNFVGNLGYVAVCVAGAVLVLNGSITFGVITAFLIYVRLFEQPLKQIAQGMTNMQSAAAAAERVFEFLESEELEDESYKAAAPAKVSGAVEFRNVRFAYPEKPEKEVIHDFSAKVEPGQKIAIVGPTGAGKTTLVNLLMRFYEVTGGEIRIDGVNIRDIRREDVHRMFGMVLQDTWLFEGTVRENLIYNCEGVTEEAMAEACKACGIHHFIKALPQGYDTVLDDNTSISAGQKQLSTIKDADVILVVKNGDIIEQGNHEELLKKNGFYAELYNSQFEQSA